MIDTSVKDHTKIIQQSQIPGSDLYVEMIDESKATSALHLDAPETVWGKTDYIYFVIGGYTFNINVLLMTLCY